MQDVTVGQPKFDNRFLIQGTDEEKLKEIFSVSDVYTPLLTHPVVDFKVRERKIGANIEIVLNLNLEGTITETGKLKNIFGCFKIVLSLLPIN